MVLIEYLIQFITGMSSLYLQVFTKVFFPGEGESTIKNGEVLFIVNP